MLSPQTPPPPPPTTTTTNTTIITTAPPAKPHLLEEVRLDPRPQEVPPLVEHELDELPEPARVVVPDGPGVSEGFQDGVALENPVHDGALLELHAVLPVSDCRQVPGGVAWVMRQVFFVSAFCGGKGVLSD